MIKAMAPHIYSPVKFIPLSPRMMLRLKRDSVFGRDNRSYQFGTRAFTKLIYSTPALRKVHSCCTYDNRREQIAG